MASSFDVTIPLTEDKCDIYITGVGAPGQAANIQLAWNPTTTTEKAVVHYKYPDAFNVTDTEAHYSIIVNIMSSVQGVPLSTVLADNHILISGLPNMTDTSVTVTTDKRAKLATAPTVTQGAGAGLLWNSHSFEVNSVSTATATGWETVDAMVEVTDSYLIWAVPDNYPFVAGMHVDYEYNPNAPVAMQNVLNGPGSNSILVSDSSPVTDGTIAFEAMPYEWAHSNEFFTGTYPLPLMNIVLYGSAGTSQCLGYIQVGLYNQYNLDLTAWKEGCPPSF